MRHLQTAIPFVLLLSGCGESSAPTVCEGVSCAAGSPATSGAGGSNTASAGGGGANGGASLAGGLGGGSAGGTTAGGAGAAGASAGGTATAGTGGESGGGGGGALPATCVFLMLGQSNMSGMAPLEQQDADALQGVYKISFKKAWLPGGEPFSVNPYNENSVGTLGAQSVGPSRAFAAELQKLLPNSAQRSLYIVNAAVSGSAIESWQNPNSENYVFMLPYLDEGLKKGALCGFVWHQGEANGGTDPAEYAGKLQGIHQHIAEHAGLTTLPWVAGQVGTQGSANDNVNKALVLIAAADKHFAWASSAGTSLVDNVHYDTPSQRLLGQRYAQKLVEVLAR